MIDERAITKFLDRKLSNYDWLKGENTKALDRALASLRPKPQIGKLWDHQKASLLLLLELQRFMLHVDMGGGKTYTCLTMLQYRKQRGEKPKAVVLVPYLTAVATWVDEVAERIPSLNCVPLLGSTIENLRTLQTTNANLYVICYQSAVAMLSEEVPQWKRKKKSKRKWRINKATVQEVFKGFDTIIMDEIHKCKSASSLTYKMCRAISARSDYAVGLTGTPFGKDLSDLWPQFYLIDFGETLGDTLGFFKSVFFTQKRNFWGAPVFTFKKKLFPALKEIIKNCSIRYSVKDFHDMPLRKRIKKIIKPNEGLEAYAQKCMKEIKEAVAKKQKGAYREVESNYLKLRQLSSGFMTLRGEDDDKLQVEFDEKPKLDALQELVEAMPHDSKMVVFHHFVFTNKLISDRLTAMKVKHARVWGGAKDPLKEIQRFKTDPKCRVLVINTKSGSSSLNLQIANYMTFFEQPDSPIDREQAERRVWRPGQTKRVFIYDLLMERTADMGLFMSNKAGTNLLADLFSGKKDL